MARPRAYITEGGHTEIEVANVQEFYWELTRLLDGVLVELIPESRTVKVHLGYQTYEAREKSCPAQAPVIGVGVSDVDLVIAELCYCDPKKGISSYEHDEPKDLGDGNWVVGGFEVVGVPMHVIGPRPNAKKDEKCCACCEARKADEEALRGSAQPDDVAA